VRGILSELKRRNVFRVAAAYAVIGWILMQVASIVFPALHLPYWTVTFVAVLLLLGFPVALFFAWAYEITPEGIRRETEIDRGLAVDSTARKLDFVVIGLLLVAIGLFATDRFWLRERGEAATAQPTASTAPMIVVLPFENLGRPEDGYFADGITDEISARLARVSGLSVIARTSAMQYKGTSKSVREIASELGVDYLLEGSVRWEHLAGEASRVRITPQLVRTADARQLWADVYEEPLSGVFRLQAEIAERVADALDLAILEPARRALRAEPLVDPEAYDFYLRGKMHELRSSTEEDTVLAQRMYTLAIERDPDFALAHARLSSTHSQMYWFHYDRTEARLMSAKAAADRALQLAPDQPEVRLALGYYYYWGHLDYARALAEFDHARRTMPGSGDVYAAIGAVRRRQGQWPEAIEYARAATRLDPGAPLRHQDISYTYRLVRDYREARRSLERATSLAPEQTELYFELARLHIDEHADTRGARALLGARGHAAGTVVTQWAYHIELWFDVYERNYQGLLDRLATTPWPVLESQHVFRPISLYRAHAYTELGFSDLARRQYDAARTLLESEIRKRPGDARLHAALGIAYAGLGLRDEAVQAGRRGVELLPVERDAWRGNYLVEDLARIYTMVGDHDEAIRLLDMLMSRPGPLSTGQLRLDPVWDPLREHPGFRALVMQ
jgi:TolB-like protein/predicted Zn-dependent protease